MATQLGRAAIAVLALGSGLGFESTALAQQDVIHPALSGDLQGALGDQLFPVYLVMQDQLELREFQGSDLPLEHRERCRTVADRLKSHAAKTQSAVRLRLAEAVERGTAADVRALWIGNAIRFRATASVIRELSQLPGVDRIRPVPVTDPAMIADGHVIEPPRPVAGFPFADDFESGGLSTDWSVTTTGDGYARASSDNSPVDAFHLELGSDVPGSPSTASATIVLNLLGQSGVGIRFLNKDYDPVEPGSGIFVSEDGLVFHQVADLFGSRDLYRLRTIDLDAKLAELGLSYSAAFSIRFTWEGSDAPPLGGMAFDEIEIAPGLIDPPGSPELHVTKLQATDLWDRGYRGDGVLVGCIDLGAEWIHPDVINRTWRNPGEIPHNGIDDDANGLIDDLVGWDFFGDDNDPISNSNHGTSSLGLIVGDGTSGQSTGIAPEGEAIVLRIGDEVGFWEAQQYCLDQGAHVISASLTFKWVQSPKPDYHMHRQVCDMELAAGIIHANSLGNQGTSTGSFPVPFNIGCPGSCPSPWRNPSQAFGGLSSVMGCAGIRLVDDSLYQASSQGPSAWEDVTAYDLTYPHTQNPTYWDYHHGGFGGGQPGLLKPDAVAYTDPVISTLINNQYGGVSGTSSSTPQLAGAMMLMRDVQPAAMPRHVAAALELTAIDLGDPGKDTRYGAGKIQIYEAARRLVTLGKFTPNRPSIGTTTRLDVYGEPNSFVLSFVGLTLIDDPLFNLLPPFDMFFAFNLDASGHASLNVPIINDSRLVDLDPYFLFVANPIDLVKWDQGIVVSPPEFLDIQQ